jgi:hypothetical protein
VSLPLDRRRRLQELGLRALLKRRFGPELAAGARPVPFSGGAMIVTDGSARVAAVFADAVAGLGPAVDIAEREGASELFFFAEENTPAVARRAARFRLAVTVIDPDGDFAPLAPDSPPPPGPVPEALLPSAGRFEAAGLEAVWEHGVLTGEWLGLEVARAVVDPGTAAVLFDVGVGKHDREANLVMYPDGIPDSFLDQAVAVVRELRRPGAPVHPANQLAPERWLRAVLVAAGGLGNVAGLRPGPPPEPRTVLRDRSVAPAWGLDGEGRAVVVACSAGIDPDAVAQAADACAQAPGWPGFPAGAARLVIAVPAGDDHPLTRRVAAELAEPAEVVVVPAGWREGVAVD